MDHQLPDEFLPTLLIKGILKINKSYLKKALPFDRLLNDDTEGGNVRGQCITYPGETACLFRPQSLV